MQKQWIFLSLFFVFPRATKHMLEDHNHLCAQKNFILLSYWLLNTMRETKGAKTRNRGIKDEVKQKKHPHQQRLNVAKGSPRRGYVRLSYALSRDTLCNERCCFVHWFQKFLGKKGSTMRKRPVLIPISTLWTILHQGSNTGKDSWLISKPDSDSFRIKLPILL